MALALEAGEDPGGNPGECDAAAGRCDVAGLDAAADDHRIDPSIQLQLTFSDEVLSFMSPSQLTFRFLPVDLAL